MTPRTGICGRCKKPIIEKQSGKLTRWAHVERDMCNRVEPIPTVTPPPEEKPADPPKRRRGRPRKGEETGKSRRIQAVEVNRRRNRRRVAHIELTDGTVVASLSMSSDFSGGDVGFILNADGLRALRRAIAELPSE